MRILVSTVLAIVFTFSINALAQKKKKSSPTIDSSQRFNIQYGSSPWNTNSQSIDSAKILVKDKNSGKVAQINLEETEPDSAIFSGRFILNWGDVEKVTPEVYIPPQRFRGKKDWIEEVHALVKSGKLKRKPFVFHKNANGERVMEVFDTRSQAAQALKSLKEVNKMKRAQKVKVKLDDKKPIAAAAVFEAAQLAAAKAAQLKLAQEAAAREAERVRLAQLERQKQIERLRKAKALKAAEKKRRQRQAAEFAKQAMEKYRGGDFQSAVKLFENSVDLDPTNKQYYYQYGVALYKTKNFNKALVILESADGPSVNPAEKNYFMGLSHLRLKELDKALDKFSTVKAANDKILSPSAAFYEGVIFFDTQRYEEAKPSFQTVLDTSQDPRMDERAEAYIERIAQILYFAQQQKTKFFFNGTFGLQYDSNVLFSSDSSRDQGTATGEGGLRTLAIGGAKWRPIYKKAHEFSTDLDLVYYYSFDDVFASADPMLVTFTTPYIYKGTMFGKGYKMEFTPGYEALFMDAESTGSRDNILNSILVKVNNTFVISTKWFTDLEIDYRSDDSKLTVSDSADDSSASKIAIKNAHTLFLDKNNSKILLGSLTYTINNADGANNVYNRIDVNTSYVTPVKLMKWDLTWSNSLTLYLANYPDRSDDRKDTNYAFNTSASKKLSKIWTLGLSAGYTRNSSNIDTFTYNQWNVMTTASFDYSF